MVFESAVPSSPFTFEPVEIDSPIYAGSLLLWLVLLTAVVPLTLAHQRRNPWCVLSLREPEPATRALAFSRDGGRSGSPVRRVPRGRAFAAALAT